MLLALMGVSCRILRMDGRFKLSSSSRWPVSEDYGVEVTDYLCPQGFKTSTTLAKTFFCVYHLVSFGLICFEESLCLVWREYDEYHMEESTRASIVYKMCTVFLRGRIPWDKVVRF